MVIALRRTKLMKRNEQDDTRLMRTCDAARYLAMSAWSVRRLVWAGDLPVVQHGEGGGPWLFDRQDLDYYIAAHKHTSVSVELSMGARKKNPAAQALGRLGGLARSKSLTQRELSAIGKKGARLRLKKVSPERRSTAARKAVLARWSKAKRRQKAKDRV